MTTYQVSCSELSVMSTSWVLISLTVRGKDNTILDIIQGFRLKIYSLQCMEGNALSLFKFGHTASLCRQYER